MAFQLSPGVQVTEKDLTNIVPAVSSSAGAFVGAFAWGPVLDVKTMSNESNLVKYFGKPTPGYNLVDFFTAANFLGYGNNLQIVRVVDADTAKNATANGAGLLIKNETHYDNSYSSGEGSVGIVAAKYPGTLANGIVVSMADSASFADWDYKDYFDSAPGTSAWADDKGSEDDELHIIVVDAGGNASGTRGTVLEKFAYVSKGGQAKLSDGSSNYYKDVLNQQSQWIWWMDHPTGKANWGSSIATTSYATLADPETVLLLGGAHGNAPADADVQAGYAVIANKDKYDVSLVLTGGHSASTVQYAIDNVAHVRLDCMVFFSPPLAAVKNNAGSEADDVVAYRNEDVNKSTSYAVMDSGWKVQYDTYNDAYVNVPLNADVAGLCARTDNTNDPWWSPAGYNRGQIKNVVKLLWSPDQTERDTLYKANVNPVVSFSGQGTILYGDKTQLSKPSAFDRINVRRLFIVLEKAIATAAKYQLFEFNDVFTRAQFRSMVEPFLRDIQGRRGIYDFRVVCNETNNTGEVIDRNEFVADIYIKPARSINFIYLNFVAVRTSVSFEEVGA
jgi:phage tail sheath protein FI